MVDTLGAMTTVWAALRCLPQRSLMGLVRVYRLFFKAWLGSACRFEPSCSAYALQALQQHGAAKGGLLTAGRLLRCHPYCHGGRDPVPKSFPYPLNPVSLRVFCRATRLFTRLFTRLGLCQASAPPDNPPIRNPP